MQGASTPPEKTATQLSPRRSHQLHGLSQILSCRSWSCVVSLTQLASPIVPREMKRAVLSRVHIKQSQTEGVSEIGELENASRPHRAAGRRSWNLHITTNCLCGPLHGSRGIKQHKRDSGPPWDQQFGHTLATRKQHAYYLDARHNASSIENKRCWNNSPFTGTTALEYLHYKCTRPLMHDWQSLGVIQLRSFRVLTLQIRFSREPRITVQSTRLGGSSSLHPVT
ncbi:hypothetical protein B0T22DRAFT_455415, partial [Podospora appendiculata]